MIKKNLFMIALLLSAVTTFSQTLFTYGKYSATAPEFLRAYNKNNTQPVTNKSKAIQDYLDLYINSRLKIREAFERGYDTLPQIKTEVENLRNQIIENYMSDPETMDRLIKEAFQRSQKDIHVGHIFIGIANGDTMAAFNQAKSVYDRLQKGEGFFAIAQEVSQDPGARVNKGDIGWITAFTLPYAIETSIYQLAPDKYSSPVRSKAGYHIFKNVAERKAVGKMKAKQILLAFPPGADDAIRKQITKRADSVYQRLAAGADFDKMAVALSNDYLTAVTGGSMPDFGVGQYEPAFEAKVWALVANGAITKPFLTSHGYHIVKRMSLVPVIADEKNKAYEQDLRQRVLLDQRWKTSRDVIYDKVIRMAGLTIDNYNKNALWALTDSLLDRSPLGIGSSMTQDSHLYKLGDTTIKVSDWIAYAQAFRFRPDGSGRKPYDEVMTEFMNSIAFQYYRDHLESFNDEFRNQMSEFRDGNLFFEIMQQEIWNRAHTDSSELQALYETNKTKYNWQKSADAVIFFCSDAAIAKTLYDQVKKTPSKWKELADALTEKVVADSSRYEWSQIPSKTKIIPVNGLVTTPLINATDNTASFAYVIKTYPNSMLRSFNEAKGLVINDYQALLEEQWIKSLRRKYPVVIDQAVLNKITQ